MKILLALAAFALATSRAQQPLLVEHGVYQVHLLLHAIGTEEYRIEDLRDGRRMLTTTMSTNDRGTKRTTVSTLTYAAHFEPLSFTQQNSASPTPGASTEISAKSATVKEQDQTRTISKPAIAFPGSGSMPAAMQMMMMRYWQYHHSPARLPILRVSPQALPVEIKLVGNEAFQIDGKMVRLTRYTVANLMFGREILWMNDSYRVAATMTFAGGLPQEEVLDEYESATNAIFHSGVRQEMLDLADIDLQVPPEASGAYAIVGARLIDGTGSPALEHATVVIKNGRINSVGAWPPPAGIRVIHAEGKTLIPGLWEMHSHYSGVEFGPALLSAGVTTARDCGGEFDFLVTIRNAIAAGKDNVLGPRLLLAGLIDAGGPLAFGAFDAETPAEGVRIVDLYADNHFQQIKVYTQLKPGVLRAIAAEAHKRGLTVTGHVPAAVTTVEGIEDGMDQINHLQFVTRGMRAEGDTGPIDLNSQRAKDLIALLKEKQIVVDPTAGWGEMAGHPKSIATASFEPGVNAAPFTLASKFRAMGTATDEAKFHERMAENLKVIKALYDAGVPIVAGSDTGLIGYGLDREMELYVEAGMPPMAALQTATLNAARAMGLESDSGTIQPGKRADIVLLDANPLDNIANVRRVDKVITEGRMYDSRKLARAVGFSRP
jgi:imidazolonepropionase-like amidohydrolase